MALFIPFDLPGWDRDPFQGPAKISAVISSPDLHRWGNSTSHSKTRPVAAPCSAGPRQLLGGTGTSDGHREWDWDLRWGQGMGLGPQMGTGSGIGTSDGHTRTGNGTFIWAQGQRMEPQMGTRTGNGTFSADQLKYFRLNSPKDSGSCFPQCQPQLPHQCESHKRLLARRDMEGPGGGDKGAPSEQPLLQVPISKPTQSPGLCCCACSQALTLLAEQLLLMTS